MDVITWLFLFCFYLLSAVETEVKKVRGREGETVTLHSNIAQIQTETVAWMFSSQSSFELIIYLSGGIITDHSDRFKDRLQLDRQTGSLSISNLNTNDSGVYQLQAKNGAKSVLKFNLTVYGLVSKPEIRPLNTDESDFRDFPYNSSCSVLCSVENGREVSLSWQREGETLSHTSSPDLNTPLSLPLVIEEYNSTYSCAAANPVSNQSLDLNTEEFCPQNAAPTPPARVSKSLLALGAALAVFLLFCVWLIWRRKGVRKRRKQQNGTNFTPSTVSGGVNLPPESFEIVYKSVRINPKSSSSQERDRVKQREEDEERGRGEEPQSTVYSLLSNTVYSTIEREAEDGGEETSECVQKG